MTQAVTPELLACPFCGGVAVTSDQVGGGEYDVTCWKCKAGTIACGPSAADRATAITAWNTRIASASAPVVPDELRKAAYYASDGPWEFDTEWNADGAYGGGPDHGTGYDDYLILDKDGRTLFGSENSTAKMIEEEYDEDGGTAWDQVAKRNAAFAVAAVNYVRSLLTAAPQPPVVATSEVDDLKHKLWMVASHATGGGMPDIEGINRSVNDICVQITACRNIVFAHGKEAGAREALATQPAEVKPSDQGRYANDDAAKALYDTWADAPGWVSWVERGNSTMQERARREVTL